jgi:hypothetical protein
MSNIIDNICKLRDILEYKDYKNFGYIRNLCQSIFDEVHRHMGRKANDYSYQLDFTSQDLRETAQAISDTFKRWNNIMCPEKNIKKLLKEVNNGKLNLDSFTNATIPIMALRRDNAQILTELRSLLEYHSVFLYFLEEASQDKFALKYTQRLK